MAASRVYAAKEIHDDLLASLVPAVKALAVGGPADESSEMGPVISPVQRDRVNGFLERARATGHVDLQHGGEGDNADGFFVAPTVVVGAEQHDEIVQKEVFGPVVSITSFDQNDDVLAWANEVEYGLASSIFTTDVARALDLSRKLQFGTVWINDHLPVVPEMPHGGFKAVGQRQRHVGLLARGVHRDQARHGQPGRSTDGRREERICAINLLPLKAGRGDRRLRTVLRRAGPADLPRPGRGRGLRRLRGHPPRSRRPRLRHRRGDDGPLLERVGAGPRRHGGAEADHRALRPADRRRRVSAPCSPPRSRRAHEHRLRRDRHRRRPQRPRRRQLPGPRRQAGAGAGVPRRRSAAPAPPRN